MAATQGALPEGLQGQCPYTLLGLCIPDDGKPLSVQEAAVDEASVESREALTLKAIGTAYRRAALKAHPDKNKGREAEAATEFVKVNLAFAFLSDQGQRESYHKHLRTLVGLREHREQQRRRWTEKDKEKQQFKADLERREANARKGPQRDSEEETLRQIREQNEELLRRKQFDMELARRERFREHSDQLHHQQKKKQPQPPFYAQGIGATEEDMEDLLHRSLLLSWPPPAAKREMNSSQGTTARDPSDNKADSAIEFPTPISLCSELWSHGAIDLCLFSKARGWACVSFTSRERAIEAALLLQRQRKTTGIDKRSQGVSAKLANKAKGLEALLQSVRSAADAADPEMHEAAATTTATTDIERDRNEAVELARETEEAAAAFAAALAAAQGNFAGPEVTAAAEPQRCPVAASAVKTPNDGFSAAVRSIHPGNDLANGAALTAAAAAFGVGPTQGTRPISCASARILAYVQSCSERGQVDARERHNAIDHERSWEWIGGSKVAANMSMEQLEAAAFGSLQRKKQQQQDNT